MASKSGICRPFKKFFKKLVCRICGCVFWFCRTPGPEITHSIFVMAGDASQPTFGLCYYLIVANSAVD